MLKPNYVGNKVFFDSANHSITTLNNTILTATKSSATSNNLYPLAYTSVVNSDRDHHTWTTLDAASYVGYGYKNALGLFLPDTVTDGKDNQLLTLYGSVSYLCSSSSHQLNNFFFLGRCTASSVTQNDAAASNLISNYIILPDTSPTQANSGTTNCYRFNIQIDVSKIGYDTNAYPLCFGFCFQNISTSVNAAITYLTLTLGFNNNNSHIPVFRPTGF